MPGPWLSTSNDYLPKLFVWITCRNDFGKLLNFVVADGQTLHIVFLLTYGAESVRVLLDITNGSCGMRVEESTALNEEEIMFWLTLKRSNTTSILTGDGSSCRRSVAQEE